MELISHLPKFNEMAMLSLDNSNLKASPLVKPIITMNPKQHVDLHAAYAMMEKVAAPAAYNEPVSSPSVTALEALADAYRDAKIPLAENSAEKLDTDVDMADADATVDTNAAKATQNPKLLISAEETVKKIDTLNKATEVSLNTVYNSVKNASLRTAAASSQFQALHTEFQAVNENIESKATIDTGTSYGELWQRLAEATASIKSDYVDFYATLMQKYTEMYEAFNEYCQKASSSAVSTGDDGNNVKFNTSTMNDGYNKFYSELSAIDKTLGSIKNWSAMNAEERESMVATLEPAFVVDDAGKIWFNIDQFNSVKGTMPSGISGGKVSTASYQAWLATFNAVGSAFQSNMQSFAQRYSQANSTFDNLNKVLSGAISSLADSAKEVLKSLG